MVKQRWEGDIQRHAVYWGRALSNPPPGCRRRLWRSASTLTEPFSTNGIFFCSWSKETSISSTLSVDLALITTLLSSRIAPYVSLPPPGCSVHSCIEVFPWQIAFQAMLRGVNETLSVGWLPHQQWHTLDDVSTQVCDRTWVNVIPFPTLDCM
jgi:hypothetical protein